MAQLEKTNPGNVGITVSQFKKIWSGKLEDYKNYITNSMLTKAEDRFKQYQESENPQESFHIRAGLSQAQFSNWYLSSMLCLEDNMSWQDSVVGGGTMAVAGAPGVAISVIKSICEEFGIACIQCSLADLTATDVNSLPHNDEYRNAVGTIDFIKDTKLPVSVLSSKMSNMSDEVFNAKKDTDTPVGMSYLKQGSIFAYKKGIAPEFGVLLLDEVQNMDARSEAALWKITSPSDKGYRGLAGGVYTFPPYWFVICDMSSASEGDISEGLRQRISADGFYALYDDAEMP